MVESTTNHEGTAVATSHSHITYNGHHLWISCQATMCFLTLVMTYITCCIARYTWKLSKVTKSYRSASVISLSTEKVQQRSEEIRNFRNRYRRIMMIICLLASSLALAKFLADQFKYSYAWKMRDDEICEIVYDITDNVMFSMAILSVYSFLWMKQWMFYRDPTVAGILYSKKLIMFSKIFGPAVLLLTIVIVIVNIIPRRYVAGSTYASKNNVAELRQDENYLGCVAIYAYTDHDQVFSLMFYASVAATFQISLLVLFIYPILQQKFDFNRVSKQRRRSSSVSKTDELKLTNIKQWISTKKVSFSRSPKSPEKSVSSSALSDDNATVYDKYAARMYSPSRNAMRKIKRATLWTLLCIFTDASLFTVFAVLGKGTPLILISLAEDINLFVNIVCIMATNTNWLSILFPICKKKTASTIRTTAVLCRESSGNMNG